MDIQTLTVGMIGTNCYILSNENARECAVIDPGDEAERIRRAAGGKRIAAILLTHGHFDHIGAVDALREEGTRVLIHPLDAPMLGNAELNASRGLIGRDITVSAAAEPVREGDRLMLAGISFEVLHTPGHTPGGVCYLTGEHLFTGDTLFEHGWGRTDLPGGSRSDIMQSLRRLLPLAKKYAIHPGHEA